ncbi:MAG: hypothetical protein AB7V50_02510 [Vampirovibrionia bacterium]
MNISLFKKDNYTLNKAGQVPNRPLPAYNVIKSDSISFKGKDMTPDQVEEDARHMYDVFKRAEELSKEKDGDMFAKVAQLMLNGDSMLAEQIIRAIRNAKADILQTRGCKQVRDERGNLKGIHVRSGSYENVFKKRLNIYSSKDLTFKDFLAKPEVLGDNKKVVVSCTGWTKPPAQFLANSNNSTIADLFDKDKPEEWPKIAECYYVEVTKDYLHNVIKELKEEGLKVQDLVFVYGVTPEGVDRAVEEFCKEANIKCVGVTCYDWIQYLENQDFSGKPPMYLVDNPKEFGKVMGSSKIIVTGGRSFAATVTNQQKVLGDGKVIPVDLIHEASNIKIPGLVIDDEDMMSTQVINAADVLLAREDTNPIYYPEVKGKENTKNLSPSVFQTVQILKSALKNLEMVAKTEKKLADSK